MKTLKESPEGCGYSVVQVRCVESLLGRMQGGAIVVSHCETFYGLLFVVGLTLDFKAKEETFVC